MTVRQLAPRETFYKGVRMRSRLEADYARYLDECGFIWQYEARCFASEQGQYLPDFALEGLSDDPQACNWYAEVKPSTITWEHLERVLARMEIVWDSEPGAYLTLAAWQYGADDPPLLVMGHGPDDWLLAHERGSETWRQLRARGVLRAYSREPCLKFLTEPL